MMKLRAGTGGAGVAGVPTSGWALPASPIAGHDPRLTREQFAGTYCSHFSEGAVSSADTLM